MAPGYPIPGDLKAGLGFRRAEYNAREMKLRDSEDRCMNEMSTALKEFIVDR